MQKSAKKSCDRSFLKKKNTTIFFCEKRIKKKPKMFIMYRFKTFNEILDEVARFLSQFFNFHQKGKMKKKSSGQLLFSHSYS